MFKIKQHLASPKGQSLAGMTIASAIHVAGYELARNSVIALFTSERTGFSSSAAMPAATGFISPLSIGLLWVSVLSLYIPYNKEQLCPSSHVSTLSFSDVYPNS